MFINMLQSFIPAFLAKILGLGVCHSLRIYLRKRREEQAASRVSSERFGWPASRDEIAENKDFPEHFDVFHFRGATLTMVDRDSLSASPLRDETLWVFPKSAKEIPVRMEMNDGKYVVSSVRVAVDPSCGDRLGPFLSGQRDLPLRMLQTLVEDKLRGLAAHAGTTPESLDDMDETTRTRLCACLSLVLQEQGFRAFDLAPFVRESSDTAAGEDKDIPSDESARTVESELESAIEKVETQRQWERVLGGLERSGVPMNEPVRAALGEVAVAHQHGELTSAQCARRIRELAKNAVLSMENHHSESDSLRWSADSLRARLRSVPEPVGTTSATNFATARPVITPAKSERPSAFLKFDRFAIYEELRVFLREKITRLDRELTRYAAGLTHASSLAAVHGFARQLHLAADLEKTIPSRNTRNARFRPDRNEMKKIIQSMNRAITSAEMTDACFRELKKGEAGSDTWNATMTDLKCSLDQMIIDFRNLRD